MTIQPKRQYRKHATPDAQLKQMVAHWKTTDCPRTLDKLIQELMLSFRRQLVHYHERYGIALDELENTARILIWKRLSTYDPSYPGGLRTYFHGFFGWHLRREVARFFLRDAAPFHGDFIEIPLKLMDAIEAGRYPLPLSAAHLEELAETFKVRLKHLTAVYHAMYPDEREMGWINAHVTSPAPSPEAVVADRDFATQLWAMVETLPPREAKVTRMRFADDLTLEEVGAAIGEISRTRVSQIEAKALRMMRHPSRSRRIVHALEYDWRRYHLELRPDPWASAVLPVT